MVMDAKIRQRRKEGREGKELETRRVEALEEISDTLIDIKSEIIGFNHAFGAYVRGSSTR